MVETLETRTLLDGDPPQIDYLYLVQDTGLYGDDVTSNPRIAGSFYDPDASGSQYIVELDVTGDSQADQSVTLSSSGSFEFNPTSLLTPGHSVAARIRVLEVVNGGGDPYLTSGTWSTLNFLYSGATDAGEAPNVDYLNLVNDTGTYGDNVTSDPRITGYLGDPDGTGGTLVAELDLNGDNVVDQTVSVSSGGSFTFSPASLLTPDQVVTARVRGKETLVTPIGNSVVTRSWSTLTFTYSASGDAGDAPTIDYLNLVNDTGTYGDNVTSDPRITGYLSDPDGTGGTYVAQLDLNGDNVVDQTVTVGSGGSFGFNPTGLLTPGQTVTARVRGRETLTNAQGTSIVTGFWSTITFTFSAAGDAGEAPQIDYLYLVNDTGEYGDGITTDARISGTLYDPDQTGGTYVAELDINNDGVIDQSVTVGSSGNFEFNPASLLTTGQQVTARVRGRETLTNSVGTSSITGSWSTLQFTYQGEGSGPTNPPPTNISGLRFTEDVPSGSTVTARFGVSNGASASSSAHALRKTSEQTVVDGDTTTYTALYHFSLHAVGPSWTYTRVTTEGVVTDEQWTGLAIPGWSWNPYENFPVTMTLTPGGEGGFRTGSHWAHLYAVDSQTAVLLQPAAPYTPNPDHYVAVIDWGDGTSSLGQVGHDTSGQSYSVPAYVVQGEHTYTDVGAYQVTVRAFGPEFWSTSGPFNYGETWTDDVQATVVPQTLTATILTPQPVLGDEFQGAVATFTDSGSTIPASGYTAEVRWGDSGWSSGTVVANGSSGFRVQGTHTYYDAGSKTLQVRIRRTNGAEIVASGTIQVAAAALLTLTEDVTSDSVRLGRFAVYNGESNSGFAARALVRDSEESEVDGDTTTYTAVFRYAHLGSTAPTWTYERITTAGVVASETFTGYAIPGWGGMPGWYPPELTTFERNAFDVFSSGFSDAHLRIVNDELVVLHEPTGPQWTNPSDYVAVIDWGDGTTTYGQMGYDTGSLYEGLSTFGVRGEHTYDTPGLYTITVRAIGPQILSLDGSSNHGETWTAQVFATVVPQSLTAQIADLQPVIGQAFGGTVVTFSDSAPAGTSANYAATITWGDGDVSNGTVTADGTGGYRVVGTHTYQSAGDVPLSVRIQRHEGARLTVTDTIHVLSVPPIKVVPGTPLADTAVTHLPFASLNWNNTQNSSETSRGITPYGSEFITYQLVPGVEAQYVRDWTGTEVWSRITVSGWDETTQSWWSANLAEIEEGLFVAADYSMAAKVEPSGATLRWIRTSSLTATINWGDGSTSAGIRLLTQGGLTIRGNHEYLLAGEYEVTTSLSGPLGLLWTETIPASCQIATGGHVTNPAGEITLGNFEFFAEIDFSESLEYARASVESTPELQTETYSSADEQVTFVLTSSLNEANLWDTVIVESGPEGQRTYSIKGGEPNLWGTADGRWWIRRVGDVLQQVDATQNALTAGDFNVAINWGDGTTSPGTVVVNGNYIAGAYNSARIVGSHSYSSGTFSASATVSGPNFRNSNGTHSAGSFSVQSTISNSSTSTGSGGGNPPSGVPRRSVRLSIPENFSLTDPSNPTLGTLIGTISQGGSAVYGMGPMGDIDESHAEYYNMWPFADRTQHSPVLVFSNGNVRINPAVDWQNTSYESHTVNLFHYMQYATEYASYGSASVVSYIDLEVTIEDVNEAPEPPWLYREPYTGLTYYRPLHFSAGEGQASGTSLGRLFYGFGGADWWSGATDPDVFSDTFGPESLQFTLDSPIPGLRLDPSGELFIDGTLLPGRYTSGVTATDGGGLSATSNPIVFEVNPIVFGIDVPKAVSADDASASVAMLIDSDLDALDGTTATFRLKASGTLDLISTLTATVQDGIAAVQFTNLPTGAMRQYIVEVEFLSTTRKSQGFWVVAGRPDRIELAAIPVQSSYVADSVSRSQVTATVYDQFNNVVQDGSIVSWSMLGDQGAMGGPVGSTNAFGSELMSPYSETYVGRASTFVRAPSLPENQVVVATAGTVSAAITLAVAPVTGALEGPDSLVIDGDPEVVNLSTNAADGTPVYWLITNGNGDSRTVVTSVTNGASAIEVSPTGKWARVGECVVLATVGSLTLAHEMWFDPADASFYAKFDRFVISGDVTSDGDFPFDPMIAPFAHIPAPSTAVMSLLANRNQRMPYYSSATATIHGAPSGFVQVSIDAGSFAEVYDPQSQMSGQSLIIPLDANGVAQIVVRSLGQLQPWNGGMTVATLDIGVTFTETIDPFVGPAPGAKVAVTTIKAVPTSWGARVADGAYGFIGGDPTGVAGIGGNVAGGMLIVGDVGSVIKNSWRWVGTTVGLTTISPNYLETALSGLGVLTELAVGVGEAADAPISGVRAIVAAVGKTKFSDALVILLKRALSNASDLTKFGSYLKWMISSENRFALAKVVFQSEDVMEAGVRVSDELGDGFWTMLEKNVIEDPTPAIQATQAGVEGATAATKALDKMLADVPGLSGHLKALSPADLTAALAPLARILNQGGVDATRLVSVIKKGFGNGLLKNGSDFKKLFEQMDKVHEAQGFADLIKSMDNETVNTLGGRLYELTAAVKIATDNAASVGVNARNMKLSVPVQNAVGKTDIDIAIGTVHYQCKWSIDAMNANANKIKAWIAKARAEGGTDFYLVFPGTFSDLSAPLRELINTSTDIATEQVARVF